MQGVILNNNGSMKALSSQQVDVCAPSTFSRFLRNSEWDPHALNLERIEYFQKLKQTKAKDGEFIYLDDSILKKTGKHIESAGYAYSHSDNKVVLGQNIVALSYRDDKKEYPLNYRVYLNKKMCEERDHPFQTRIEMAQDMLGEIQNCGLKYQTVVMDSWFVAKDLIDIIKDLEYSWVGRIKSNRICFVDGQKMSIKEYALTIPDCEWKEVPIPYETNLKKDEPKTQFITSKIVNLKSLGTIKMVFVKPSQDEETVLFLGTDRLELSAQEIIEIYTGRWRIETFFRDNKQNLALSQYMGRSFIGFERYLSLVFTSYSFIKYLTHTGYWGQNGLNYGETFGEQLDNFRQLSFEGFLELIYKLGVNGVDLDPIIGFFRKNYKKADKINDQVYFNLKNRILVSVG